MPQTKHGFHDEQLGKCQFYMDYDRHVFVKFRKSDSEAIELNNATICTSYSSVVAIHDPINNIVFLLQRHNYSPTTTRQVNRWLRTLNIDINNILKVAEFSYDGIGWYKY